MARLEFDARAAARELSELNQRMARGLSVLRKLSDVHLGATAREAVFKLEGVTLYRYLGQGEAAGRTPLLIVYALVNRPEMADLQQGRSLVAGLIERGFDVYLVDWGYPNGADQLLGLQDYVLRYLDACVEHLRQRLHCDQVNLLGICQGGTFSVCYSALRPEKVSRLITTVTPIDFHTDGDMLSRLVRHVDLDALVDAHGNISGDFLNALFLMLKPYRLLQQKYVRFLDQIDDEAAAAMFLRMEQWVFDSPALTARACREFGKSFYQENRLVGGTLTIGHEAVDLSRLTMPILNIWASEDHLVPPASSLALGTLIAGDNYQEVALPGGHIGVYVGTRASASLPATVAHWFERG